MEGVCLLLFKKTSPCRNYGQKTRFVNPRLPEKKSQGPAFAYLWRLLVKEAGLCSSWIQNPEICVQIHRYNSSSSLCLFHPCLTTGVIQINFGLKFQTLRPLAPSLCCCSSGSCCQFPWNPVFTRFDRLMFSSQQSGSQQFPVRISELN